MIENIVLVYLLPDHINMVYSVLVSFQQAFVDKGLPIALQSKNVGHKRDVITLYFCKYSLPKETCIVLGLCMEGLESTHAKKDNKEGKDGIKKTTDE